MSVGFILLVKPDTKAGVWNKLLLLLTRNTLSLRIMATRRLPNANWNSRPTTNNRTGTLGGVFPGITLCVLALLVFSLKSFADETTSQDEEEAAPSTVEPDSFRGPVLLEHVVPHYPQNRLMQGEESWVELKFMVDTEGKPYEIIVVDSIGHDSFRSAAVRAVKRWKYQPAIYNGTPIEAGSRYKIVFHIEGQPKGASDWFVSQQSALRKSIAEDDRKKADEYMETLENAPNRSLYEDAFFNFAKYEYMSKWGTEDQQLEALDRAIAHEATGKYLPSDVFVYALGKQLPLLLKKRDYQRAFITNSILAHQDINEETKTNLESIKAALDELRANEKAYDLPATIGDSASWNIGLFKDEFWFEDVQGHIVELKLRCDRDMRIIRYDPEIRYKVEGHVGACFLEVLGDKGTTFRMFQS